MSLKKESETSWEMVTANGERNQYDSVTATKDGLEIGYCGEIPWDDLDRARHAVAHANNHKHGDIASFCSIRYCVANLPEGHTSTFHFERDGVFYDVAVTLRHKMPNVQGDRRCAASSRSVQRAKRTGSTAGLGVR